MILPPGTHCSRLSRNGSHMSTHTASIPFRWRLVNSVRKYSSSVSFLRSFPNRSEEHTSELQSLRHLVCRLLLEKTKTQKQSTETWHRHVQHGTAHVRTTVR